MNRRGGVPSASGAVGRARMWTARQVGLSSSTRIRGLHTLGTSRVGCCNVGGTEGEGGVPVSPCRAQRVEGDEGVIRLVS